MSSRDILKAAEVANTHGYILVPRKRLEEVNVLLDLKNEEILGELFGVKPLVPMVQLHPDDVTQLIHQLSDSNDENAENVHDVLQEALEATNG